ncbi:hypothetical protein EDB86DRAFT_2947119 [Lactarius hatsudake]|nr:hypothetical protein EDB86DRAFT_2947119 [Lactarius hatsudake]
MLPQLSRGVRLIHGSRVTWRNSDTMEGSGHDVMEGSGHDAMEGSGQDAMEGSGHDAMEGSGHNAMEGSGRDAMEGSGYDALKSIGYDAMEDNGYNATEADHVNALINALRCSPHGNVAPLLKWEINNQEDPDNQAVHGATAILHGIPVGKAVGTSKHFAVRAAAQRALVFLEQNGILYPRG